MAGISIHKAAEIRVATECCIVCGTNVLLLKRDENSANFPGFWSLPGGHVDLGEDLITSAIREVNEETGITVEPSQVKLKVSAINHHLDREQVWIVFAFKITLESEPIIHDSMEGHLQWFDIQEAHELDNVFPPVQLYFRHILGEAAGVLYMSGEWRNSELVRLTSEVMDSDY